MPFVKRNNLRYFQFSLYQSEPLTQAIFTRHGGVSPAPWKSLNIGGTVGDAQERVRQNKHRLLQAVGRSPDSLFEIWQVHEARVLLADGANPDVDQVPQADAVITDLPGVTLLMRFADCVPIYLYDPEHAAIGMAHAGWKGTLMRIAGRTVQHMVDEFGTDPAAIIAGLGPSIGPDHYVIGPDVVARVTDAFPEQEASLLITEGDEVKLDLWEANRLTLAESGVDQVEVAGICTACRVQDWYSHREENGRTGRFGALFALGKS